MLYTLYLIMGLSMQNPKLVVPENFLSTLENFGFAANLSNVTNFPKIYKEIKDKNQPMYITIDPLLHGIHLIYDFTLIKIEEKEIFPELLKFLIKLDLHFRDLIEVKNIPISQSAKTNLAFVEVAIKLMKPEFSTHPSVQREVTGELENIIAHEGFDTSLVLGVIEDYSQYIPRGHYTKSDTLRRYFKAMMWLGRMPFYLSPQDKNNLQRNIHHTRCAILMTKTIEEDSFLFQTYKRINELITYFVGETDDLNPLDFTHFIDKHFPDFPTGFSDDSKVLEFMKDLSNLRKPRIFSTFFRDIDLPKEKLLSFKLFGQRFIPDGFVFQNLVYPKVGTRSKPRLFPKGLDLMAVLSSQRAYEILIDFFKEDSFKNYTVMMDSLKCWFKNYMESEGEPNAYLSWLKIIKTMNEKIVFPKDLLVNPVAYRDKILVTQQAFWAELRHDTILYAKQGYTAKVTAFRPEPLPEVRVEPLPESYKEIMDFIKEFKGKLREQKIEDEEIHSKLDLLHSLTEAILKAENYQKGNKEIPLPIRSYLYGIGEILDDLYSFSRSTEKDDKLPLIADVHTDVNTKRVLEVGIGYPLIIYIKGKDRIYKGAMFSYYEFTWPMSERLTDEEWIKVLPETPTPKWINFIGE